MFGQHSPERGRELFGETNKGAEIIHETGCFAIVQGPLAQLSPRVCPTACWAIGKQLVSQINLMMVSCIRDTPWGTNVLES
ncbi:hypothetical protein BCU68_08485 [Vibrio sp. 10N.286.49.B3]|nr:hypothetical protein BCU68_08485 [Vibrio sp. 10N.286.49.B3]